MHALNALAPVLVVLAFSLVQVARARGRRADRLAAERRAAAAPLAPPVAPAPQPVTQPGAPRLTQPVARLPKRAEPAAPRAAPAVRPSFGMSGPRWAANAVIAAEVFGPPLALREGGTSGPPHAL